MGNITLSVPDDVHEDMRRFNDIRWSEVARRAIVDKIETLKIAESIAKKSKLTTKDVEDFSKKIKASAAKKFVE